MKRRLLTALLFLFVAAQLFAQLANPALVDSFKLKIAKAKTTEDKIDQMASLSMILVNTNQAEADRYGALMVQEAEISRQRTLIAKAHYYNGLRYSFLSVNKEFIQKSLASYNQSLNVAKENKLDKETVDALLGLADVTTRIPDLDKALSYTNQAFSVASSMKNDSLQVSCYMSFGNVYNRKKERLLALRNYLQGLRIAEEIKNHNYLRSCYSSLANFYAGLKEYDKAIDFAQKALDELYATTAENKNYQRVMDLNGLGNLYVLKKNFEMSVHYFETAIKLADSLHYEPLKMPGYNGLLNQYLEANQPQKALEFFNTRSDLKAFIRNFGFGHIVDHAYGVIYTKLGKFDSAKIYFENAEPSFEAKTNPSTRIGFYTQYGELYDKSGNLPKAIEYYVKAKTLADGINNLEWQQDVSKGLDSLYAKAGDFQQSRLYGNLYYSYKDSLQKLGEQKDLMQTELADEQQRLERQKKEELAALERRHNIQYMGMAIGIAVVFVLLVAMGIFRVSVGTIKVMGFFSFILLFEFIILIADTKIHHLTHGEPLPILGIKIVLIAMLLPLHHWLEHKVVSYLASRRLIVPSGKSLWQTIKGRKLHREDAH